MALYARDDVRSEINETAYVSGSATIIGNVTLGADINVRSGVVVRADNEPMNIGVRTNIQDGAVLHSAPGCRLIIGAGSLVGIQAVILNGAVIGRNCLVAAGAIVTEGKVFDDNMLILGAPAKAVRQLTESRIVGMAANAEDYVKHSSQYKRTLQRIG